jgi:hypothetical protein
MQVNICDPQISVQCPKVPSFPSKYSLNSHPLKIYAPDVYTVYCGCLNLLCDVCVFVEFQ